MSDFALNVFGSPPPHRDGAPAFYGVTVGIVTNNADPEKLGRVRVRLPWLSDTEELCWARVATPMAGKERGVFFLPEVDDEVLVAFEHGRPEFPFVIGALWNGKDTPPEVNANGNNDLRVIKSRSGHCVRLDDTEGKEKIEIVDKSGKNSISFDSANNTITITADADLELKSTTGTVKISGKGVEIKTTADLKAEAGAGLQLKASAQMKLQGATIDLN